MNKVFLPFILLILLTSCVLPPSLQKTKEKLEIKEAPPLPNLEPSSVQEYTLEQLQSNIESALNQTILIWKKEEGTPLYTGNAQRSYIIYQLKEPIVSASDFYNQFSASRWDGQKYFANQTQIQRLQTDLSEKDFKEGKDYQNYFLYRTTIEQKTVETVHSVASGKVLEYQHLNWMFDKEGYWQGSWVDTLLIYKAYCSKNFVVLLRPTWDKFTLGVSGSAARSAALEANWETEVKSLRKKMLVLADKIMENCPVDKSFFETFPTKPFKESKKFYYYLPVELKNWNLNADLSVKVAPGKNTDGKMLENQFTVEKLEMVLKNNGLLDLELPLFLEVITIADNKEKDTFVSDKKLGQSLRIDKPFSDTIYPLRRPLFFHNLTIQIMPFALETRKFPLKSMEFVLFVNNTLVRR